MNKNYGIIAAFDTTSAVFHACEQVRDAGYSQWDALTPFPIHGLDAAMGMPRSKVPRFSLLGGLTGFTTGMTFIWWANAHEYALIVGGKPFFSPMFAFPVFLRAHDSLHGLRDDHRHVRPEQTADALPSGDEGAAIRPRHG